MAAEGPRRSTRVRKAVKSYADEQIEDHEKAVSLKRKRASPDDNESSTMRTKPTKITSKKSKSSTHDDETDGPETTRKAPKASSSKPKRTTTNSSWHADAAERRIAVNKRKLTKLSPGQQETRLRSYVEDPPKSYHDALKRANTQRMFVLDRERGVEEDCHANHHDCPCESIQIAGSTGNVYTVTISHVPSCTCPVGIFTRKSQDKLCKHALYVLHNVLKAPDHLKQQNAFLTSELQEIFSNAPALPTEVVEDEPMDGNRKATDDDCPICFMEFEDKGDEIVWCRAACGNNIHKACFDQWANAKMGHVTCPFCRAPWEYGGAPKTQKVNVASVKVPVERGFDGYRNVRDQLEYD